MRFLHRTANEEALIEPRRAQSCTAERPPGSFFLPLSYPGAPGLPFLQPRIALVRPAAPPARPEFDQRCAFNDADPQLSFRSGDSVFRPRVENGRNAAEQSRVVASARLPRPDGRADVRPKGPFVDACVGATDRVASSEPREYLRLVQLRGSWVAGSENSLEKD